MIQRLLLRGRGRSVVLIDIYMKFIEDIMNRFQFTVQKRNCVTKFQEKLLKKCKCKCYGSCTLHIDLC